MDQDDYNKDAEKNRNIDMGELNELLGIWNKKQTWNTIQMCTPWLMTKFETRENIRDT